MTQEDDLGDWRASIGRDYGEEGIPVILAVEAVGAPLSRAGATRLAEAFRALAGNIAALDPEPAALIEVLAARELRRLG